MRVVSIVFVGALSAPVVAQHGGDITILVQNKKMRSGLIEELPGGGTTVRPERVFESEFFDFGGIIFSDEPGFDVPDGTLAPESLLGFNILKALRAWDGSAFSGVPMETITIGLGPQSRTTPLGDVPVAGFGIKADEEGGVHGHYDFMLDPPSGTGVYLLELQLWDDAGLATTKPFWIVFNHGEDEGVHEAAIGWTRENLVPAPSAWALLVLVGVKSLCRRRCARPDTMKGGFGEPTHPGS